MAKDIEDIVQHLVAADIAPKQIRMILRDQHRIPDDRIPERRQISNYRDYFRRHKESDFLLGTNQELQEWCEGRKNVPDGADLHTPFVLDYCVREDDGDGPCTVVILTTHKLLKNRNLDVWHCDATYKLAFRKWPVFVVGGQSPDRHFHLIAIGLICGETHHHFRFFLDAVVRNFDNHPGFIVSDACDAEGLAIEQVLPNTKLIMCWFHMGSKACFNVGRASEAYKALANNDKVPPVQDHCIFIAYILPDPRNTSSAWATLLY
jgi:hypothetical protein